MDERDKLMLKTGLVVGAVLYHNYWRNKKLKQMRKRLLEAAEVLDRVAYQMDQQVYDELFQSIANNYGRY